MYNGTSYENLSNQCKSIIKNKSPEVSVKKISELESPLNGQKLGNKNALKIYSAYSNESVKYDSNLYKNNIIEYSNKVNSNIEKAYSSIKK
jgi:hypothetical protein